MMMVRFSDWMINWQLSVHQIVDGGFAREPYNDAIAQPLALQDPMVQSLCFKDVSVWGEKGSIFLLVGERQKCLLTLWQVDNISGLGHVVGNVFRCLDTPQLNQTFTRLCKRTG